MLCDYFCTRLENALEDFFEKNSSEGNDDGGSSRRKESNAAALLARDCEEGFTTAARASVPSFCHNQEEGWGFDEVWEGLLRDMTASLPVVEEEDVWDEDEEGR